MAKATSKQSNAKGGQYKTSKKHRQIVKEYDEKNTQSIRVKLNKKTDKDILSKLNKSSNKQGLIKKALRGKSLSVSEKSRTSKSKKK